MQEVLILPYEDKPLFAHLACGRGEKTVAHRSLIVSHNTAGSDEGSGKGTKPLPCFGVDLLSEQGIQFHVFRRDLPEQKEDHSLIVPAEHGQLIGMLTVSDAQSAAELGFRETEGAGVLTDPRHGGGIGTQRLPGFRFHGRTESI